MTDHDGPSDPTPDGIESMFNVLDSLTSSVLAMCYGYRARCQQEGFSDEIAQQMALDLHHVLMGRIKQEGSNGN